MNWTKARDWAIDSVIVLGLGLAAYTKAISVELAVPVVVAVVAARLPPKGNLGTTVLGPIVSRVLTALAGKKA